MSMTSEPLKLGRPTAWYRNSLQHSPLYENGSGFNFVVMPGNFKAEMTYISVIYVQKDITQMYTCIIPS